jgi:hypothetical protein
MWIFYTGADPILRAAVLFVVCGVVVGAAVWLFLWLRK